MILIGDASNKELSEGIAKNLGVSVIYPEITVFPDSEKRVRIPESVAGEIVYLLKSINKPVDSAVIEFSLLASALINNGADKIVGIVPYLPYMRADHVFRSGEGIPLDVIVKLFEASGIHKIMIVDPHSVKIPEFFSIPVVDLSALGLFAQKIREIETDNSRISIVSPDMGGINRLKVLSEMLGGVNQIVINKDRDYESGAVSIAERRGEINGRCFIVDDIISTGKTIAQAVERLSEDGAEEVYVMGVHAVFSENAHNLLADSCAEKVFITDSISFSREKKFDKLEILTLSNLIADSIKARVA